MARGGTIDSDASSGTDDTANSQNQAGLSVAVPSKVPTTEVLAGKPGAEEVFAVPVRIVSRVRSLPLLAGQGVTRRDRGLVVLEDKMRQDKELRERLEKVSFITIGDEYSRF